MSETIYRILQYEDGTLSETETLRLFQDLVDSGLAWTLQGSYGRVAAALLANGDIAGPDEVPS